ncbi:MAG: hypothetical protein PF485_10125 [Bacteroidales bacterium]|jgi:hypothetical protein|nr:hypothetical protein [Bacteroidales bacterium]
MNQLIKQILFTILISIIAFTTYTQNVPVHHLNSSIYDFMDELAITAPDP